MRTINIDALNLAELDALRSRIGLTRAELCRRAEVSKHSYQRWMRWLHGEAGGAKPRPASMSVVRRALAEHLRTVPSAAPSLEAFPGSMPPV